MEEHLYVYVISKKDGAMALAEVWTFTMVLDSEDSSSSRSSKGRPSFTVSPIAGQDVDQNYFKVDPDQYRKTQAMKFAD